MEFTLLWAALTAAAGLWIGTRFWSGSEAGSDFDRLLAATLAGVAVGRVVAMLAQGQNPVTSPGELFIVRGGVDTGFAAVAAIATLLAASRASALFMDRVAPTAVLGLSGWHLGCLWRNACLGTAADLPWSWSLPASQIARQPVEIYAGLAFLIAAVLISRLPDKPWLATGAAIAVASAVRWMTEPIRLSITGGPVGWYAAGTIIGLLVVGAASFPGRLEARDVDGET